MAHAPQFWADKLPKHLRPYFWALVNTPEWWLRVSGETAYHKALALVKD